MTAESPLDAFLRTLAARDASPHTQRAYATAVGGYLDWLDAATRIDWREPPRAALRAYLGQLGEGHARTSVGPAARRDPFLLPVRHPRRPHAGDPWGAIATPGSRDACHGSSSSTR